MSASYRLFELSLKSRHQITPSLLRCVFTGDDVAQMKHEAPDQRIKLLFSENGAFPEGLGQGDNWYQDYLALPKANRPAMRTYTLRALRLDEREMDVEFVLHGENGPASRWATHAKPGDQLLAVAPDAAFDGDSGGYEWNPPEKIRQALLIADETALPAATGILEQLANAQNPPQVQAFFEVPLTEDILDMSAYAFATIHWIARERAGVKRHGETLLEEVKNSVDIPDWAQRQAQSLASSSLLEDEIWERADGENPFYAWVAGESTTVKNLRRYLTGERDLDRACVNFMAYWSHK
ncbi:siderophore-interacting protein [Atlantibacter hermannii]|uniref:siderophore-interacting protein n=1 Tax=Atlantibacter hermannii TaxID=565 RepID=UPI001C6FE350|nr:siderophore-interacting protein [Atlantibacter hermannii]MBW9431035.1 siderophore-interacting protein [Atlantibacter hermannii]